MIGVSTGLGTPADLIKSAKPPGTCLPSGIGGKAISSLGICIGVISGGRGTDGNREPNAPPNPSTGSPPNVAAPSPANDPEAGAIPCASL